MLLDNEAITSEATPTAGSSTQAIKEKTARRRARNKRLKWTQEMNADVIRISYRVNRCEDNPLPGYRLLLHSEFTKLHPELDLTEQNIVDRRNVIIRKSYLPTNVIDQIRREVGHELHQISIAAPNEQTGYQPLRCESVTPTRAQVQT